VTWIKSKDRTVSGPDKELLSAYDIVSYLGLDSEDDEEDAGELGSGEAPPPRILQEFTARGLLPPPIRLFGEGSLRWAWMDVVCLNHLVGATARAGASAPPEGERAAKK
jgi:hypothetical protein